MSIIQDNILKSIQILVDTAISKANFDRTVMATIVECEDEVAGKYRVKYQNSTFYAYGSSDPVYSKDSTVYVLIPGNDASLDKTILGKVDISSSKNNLEVATRLRDNEYDDIGRLCISASDTSLHSYQCPELVTIPLTYSTNGQAELYEYLKEATYLKFGATFTTSLPIEQQTLGIYGIVLTATFNTKNGETIQKTFNFDINSMLGTPYNYIEGSEQYQYFPWSGEDFVSLDSVQAYCKDFPNYDETKPYDIKISNLIVSGAKRATEKELDSYRIKLSTPDGSIYFSNSDSSTRTIRAQLRVQNKFVSDDSVEWYWYVKDGNTNRLLCNNHYGYTCLNKYNVVKSNEGEAIAYQWVPGGAQLTITRPYAKEIEYMCEAVYDGIRTNKSIIIKNKAAIYDVTIESDSGTAFHFDTGTPTLTCTIDPDNGETFIYQWMRKDAGGDYQIIEGATSKTYTVTIATITVSAEFACAVTYNDNLIGVGTITLTNDENVSDVNQYMLFIKNGSQVFKYSADGVSPVIEEGITIQPLEYEIYTGSGETVTPVSQKWYVPAENTLIDVSQTQTLPEPIDGYYIFTSSTLAYSISESYDYSKTNNTIKLEVTTTDATIIQYTNLLFLKEGESGTNGTDVITRIVPNVITGEVNPPTPYFINGQASWTQRTTNLFKVEVWDGATQLDLSQADIDIQWSIKNGDSWFSIGDNEISEILHTLTYNYNSSITEPINLLQVQTTYNGVIEYAIMPLVTVRCSNEDVKVSQGCREVTYTADGKKPKYNNKTPFIVSINDSQATATWSVVGQQYIEIESDRTLHAKNNYNGKFLASAVLLNNGNVHVHFPIYLHLDRYNNSALNGWDGNSIEINDEGGYILAPQIGAGEKDNENGFTGIVMGTQKLTSSDQEETGLFAYNSGAQTVKIKAEDGSVTLGTNGNQIIIDPNEETTEIHFQNTDGKIYSGNHNTFNSKTNGFYLSSDGISIGDGFSVDSEGNLNAQKGYLGDSRILTEDDELAIEHSQHAWKLRSAKITGTQNTRYYVSLTNHRNLIVSDSAYDPHSDENDVTDVCNVGSKSYPWHYGYFNRYYWNDVTLGTQYFKKTLTNNNWIPSNDSTTPTYRQTIAIPGIKMDHENNFNVAKQFIQVTPLMGTNGANMTAYNNAGIICIRQNTDELVFQAIKIPETGTDVNGVDVYILVQWARPAIDILDPPFNLILEYDADNNEVNLIWHDSNDEMFATWDQTILVRKQGSAPENIDDGVQLPLTAYERDKYATSPYVDDADGLNGTYYYAVFCNDTSGEASHWVHDTFEPITLANPVITNITVDIINATITYDLPEIEDVTYKLVYKADSIPQSSTDGTAQVITGTSVTLNELTTSTTFYAKIFGIIDNIDTYKSNSYEFITDRPIEIYSFIGEVEDVYPTAYGISPRAGASINNELASFAGMQKAEQYGTTPLPYIVLYDNNLSRTVSSDTVPSAIQNFNGNVYGINFMDYALYYVNNSLHNSPMFTVDEYGTVVNRGILATQNISSRVVSNNEYNCFVFREDTNGYNPNYGKYIKVDNNFTKTITSDNVLPQSVSNPWHYQEGAKLNSYILFAGGYGGIQSSRRTSLVFGFDVDNETITNPMYMMVDRDDHIAGNINNKYAVFSGGHNNSYTGSTNSNTDFFDENLTKTITNSSISPQWGRGCPIIYKDIVGGYGNAYDGVTKASFYTYDSNKTWKANFTLYDKPGYGRSSAAIAGNLMIMSGKVASFSGSMAAEAMQFYEPNQLPILITAVKNGNLLTINYTPPTDSSSQLYCLVNRYDKPMSLVDGDSYAIPNNNTTYTIELPYDDAQYARLYNVVNNYRIVSNSVQITENNI